MKKASKKYPQLTRFGFWDVDMSKLDYDKYAQFVILRVMERGSKEDVNEIIRYYGNKKIIKEITSVSSLSPAAIALGRYYFNLKNKDFKCFTNTRRRKNLLMH